MDIKKNFLRIFVFELYWATRIIDKGIITGYKKLLIENEKRWGLASLPSDPRIVGQNFIYHPLLSPYKRSILKFQDFLLVYLSRLPFLKYIPNMEHKIWNKITFVMLLLHIFCTYFENMI